MILPILEELRATSKTNEKLAILKREKDNELLKRVLKMTYDNVAYTYGMTVPQIEKFAPARIEPIPFDEALNLLENNIASRVFTGHDALQYVANLIGGLDDEHGDTLKKIINRDLRINVGKTQINKIWKGLIIKPVYMRCGVYSEKTAKDIKYPAYIQLKADGTYREFHVQNNMVTCRSRSGESYEYPILFETMSCYPDGVYVGELTVRGVQDRGQGNGLINSDEPPHEDIIAELWDYITLDEYEQASKKDRKNPCEIAYQRRWFDLNLILAQYNGRNVGAIDSHIVNSLPEALKKTSEYMNNGLEGAILKDMNGVFKDGTSKHQLKLKVSFSIEVRVTGFIEGKIGTKREETFGSLTYSTDDGLITGSVSGFTDKQLSEINNNRDSYINTVMEIEGNDLTKAVNSDTYAVSHPRFVEFRIDRDSTDTLERALESLDMAKHLS